MRVVIQRVLNSHVEIDGKIHSKISKGFNVLLGISKEDTLDDAVYLAGKISKLRVFEDENHKLNKSLKEVNGELLIISNFTLYGDCRKGNRPSFINAEGGDVAKNLYEAFIDECKKHIDIVESGVFGEDMKIHIENDGSITLIIDSKK